MSCKNCSGYFQGRCDCCYLVDGTETIKEVFYCEDCEAFICKSCKSNWLKRSAAYFLKKLGNPIAEQPAIEESIDEFQQEINNPDILINPEDEV